MTIRICTRCHTPYGEGIIGALNVAKSFAPFCSKRCADVDLMHWLSGDYRIDDQGELGLSEDEPDGPVFGQDDEDEVPF